MTCEPNVRFWPLTDIGDYLGTGTGANVLNLDHRGNVLLTCPNCGERTISPIRKLLLGPVFEHRCSACRKHWSISQWSVVAAGVVVASYLAFLYLVDPSELVANVGMIVAAVTLGLALIFLVPVRK